MDRRDFIKSSALATAALMFDWEKAFALGAKDPAVGKAWKGWKKGHFQVHFIYTGVAESMFMIFPDGTSMLLDCGDHNAIGRGKLAVPVLPSPDKHAGEWIARYVQRVNPHGNKVDYMMLSHYHSDHGGNKSFNAGVVERDGKPYPLSGFSHAAEWLSFGKAFDRAWPDYDDPIPLIEKSADCVEQMRMFYEYMSRNRGLRIEKFQVGATDQVRMLHSPGKYPGFSVRNICGNGRIAAPNGRIIDLYAERKKENPLYFNENGMSLGMVISYGPFRFYTAGDFSDKWRLPDRSEFQIEDAIADVCGKVSVAKINHHGHYSMTRKLLEALQARVYVSCVWDQLHNVAPVMERIADQNVYPGERIVCPGIFPKERRIEDAGKEWLGIIHKDSFDGGHVVLDVPKGGKEYSITYLTAADESMKVLSVMNFRSSEAPDEVPLSLG
ncbi:MAG: MBL fold metallo-hydrolase [Bacteroidales bacterium]|nr:MBL fold metallo-hydrolase [Bacteroidales bacterium]